TQTITVNDTTPPTITIPVDRQLQCGAATDPAHTGTATATDSCGGSPTISYSDSPAGGCTRRDFNRTWTANDVCGNSQSFVQHITFVDTTPPTITTCPTGGDLGTNPASLPTCDGVKAQVQANDNCGTVTLICSESDTINACTHVRTFTITALDTCGNASSPCVVVYTWVVITDHPVFSYCPSDHQLVSTPSVVA